MTPNFLFYCIFTTIIFFVNSYASLTFCFGNVNSETKNPQNISKCKRASEEKALPKVTPKKEPLDLIKELFRTIKEDVNNHSYNQMLEDVKAEHSIKYHKPNAPFFYSNDAFVMKDIIDLLLDDPDGFIDETKTKGVLKVYRNNDYHNEIEELFDREPYYRREIPQPKKFQKDYLGLTPNGPTNQVMVTLKLKGDEQNADTLEKRLAYIGNNIVFVDAFPVKSPPPPPKGKASPPLPQNRKSNSGVKSDDSKPEDSKAGESTAEESKAADTKDKDLKDDRSQVDAQPEKPLAEDSKATDAKSEDTKSPNLENEEAKAEKGKPASEESLQKEPKVEESKSDKGKPTEKDK